MISDALNRSRFFSAATALACLLVACLASPGCSEDEPRDRHTTDMAVSDVPENVMVEAKKALPGVKFEEAWKVLDANGKMEGYEVRGRNNVGKIREVRVSPEGKILEME